MHRIRSARVFCLRAIVEVADTGDRIKDDVFQHRSEALRGGIYRWLGFGAQLDRLGIATALEIEDAFGTPTVLVVTDQRPPGVGGQCRFPGSRQAEEDRRITFGPDICRTMHRHDGLGGKKVVHRREDGLLDLAGIRTSSYQDDLSA